MKKNLEDASNALDAANQILEPKRNSKTKIQSSSIFSKYNENHPIHLYDQVIIINNFYFYL